jgi:hypothetical protein
VEYNPFPDMGGCAKLPWVRRGLRFTVSLRTGVVLIGGRKTADFLGDRTSVRVMSGSGTATRKRGRKAAEMLRNRSAAQKFFLR